MFFKYPVVFGKKQIYHILIYCQLERQITVVLICGKQQRPAQQVVVQMCLGVVYCIPLDNLLIKIAGNMCHKYQKSNRQGIDSEMSLRKKH